MKKFIILLLTLVLLGTTAFADEPVTAPSPEQGGLLIAPAPSEEQRLLLQSLAKGIIPVSSDMTYEDFISYMNIVDDSEEKIKTTKFETFIAAIEYYYYGNLSADDVFELFKRNVDSVDINDIETTYKAMFSMLDRFSYYLTAEEAESFFSPTSSKGIGIAMVWHEAKDGKAAGVYIDEVAKGSPAEKAGIKVGDRIVSFNGQDMRGLGFESVTVYTALVDPEAPTLTLSLERGETVTEYTLERTTNTFSEYTMQLFPEKELIYLDINSFMYESTASDIALALDAAWDLGYDNIIIDLQSNSGGDVYVAAEILSKFTPEAEVLFYMGRDGRTDSVAFESKGNGHDFDKIYVLVDEYTASSAEIFADTINKIDDAEIVGRVTYGKGVAQTVLSVVDGSAIGITTFCVYDTNGNTYNEKGVIPDNYISYKIEKNSMPKGLPSLTALNYSKAVSGAENSVVKGLEIRLAAIGFLSPDAADGKWDDTTTMAVAALQTAAGLEVSGTLDETTFRLIVKLIKEYENTYYYTFTAFDYAYRFVPYVK